MNWLKLPTDQCERSQPMATHAVVIFVATVLVLAAYAVPHSLPLATRLVVPQGINGHISLGPITPSCPSSGVVGPAVYIPPSTGIVYGEGVNRTVQINWTRGSCTEEGDFRVFLDQTGDYYFTLSNCTTGLYPVFCAHLPAYVRVNPNQMAQLNITIDTGIR